MTNISIIQIIILKFDISHKIHSFFTEQPIAKNKKHGRICTKIETKIIYFDNIYILPDGNNEDVRKSSRSTFFQWLSVRY